MLQRDTNQTHDIDRQTDRQTHRQTQIDCPIQTLTIPKSGFQRLDIQDVDCPKYPLTKSINFIVIVRQTGRQTGGQTRERSHPHVLVHYIPSTLPLFYPDGSKSSFPYQNSRKSSIDFFRCRNFSAADLIR